MEQRRHSQRYLAFVLSLLLLAGIGVPLSGGAASEIGEGTPAPAFALTALDGKTIRLSDYRGKVLLLDFWHTY